MKLIKDMIEHLNKMNEHEASSVITDAEYMLDRFEGKMSKTMEAELKEMVSVCNKIIADLRDTRKIIPLDTNPERPGWKIRKDDRDFSGFERRAYNCGYWDGFRDLLEQLKNTPDINNVFRFGVSHNEP